MKAPYKFIVEPYQGKRYENTVKFGDIEINTSFSEEDHKFANRFVIVKETPLGYKGDIKIGDKLVVHHNILKFYNNIKLERSSSSAFFKDNIFMVGFDQFYLYGDFGKWKCHDNFCFVKPIESGEKTHPYIPLMGTMKFVNNTLSGYGLKEGDRIVFCPESEYEFRIEGELLYRVYEHMIVGKI